MSIWSNIRRALNYEITPGRPRAERVRVPPRRRPFSGVLDAPIFLKRARLRSQWILFNQLHVILKANAPLVPGIGAAIHDAPTARLAWILQRLKDRIDSGDRLSTAMESRPDFFPARVRELVNAGEIAGQPAKAFQSLIEEWESRISRRSEMGLILSYAATLIFVQFGIVSFLLLRVAPVFAEILADFGAEPLGMVAHAGNTRNFLAAHPYEAALAVVLPAVMALVLGWTYRRMPPLQRIFTLATRRVPIFGRYFALHNLSHAALVMQRLMDGGVPLPEVLRRIGASRMNAGYAGVFARLAARVEHGASLHDALETERYYLPASFRALVSLGENAGIVPEACGNIGRLYAAELERTARVMTSALVPAVAASAGAVTLLACLGVYGTGIRVADAIMGQL